MNHEHDTARIVESWLEQPGPPLPDGLIDRTMARVPSTAQHRHRSLGSWFGRRTRLTTSAEERGRSTASRSRTGWSVVAAAGVAAVMAVLVVGTALVIPRDQTGPGVVPVTWTGETLVVGQDGSARFDSIPEAVEAAQDGDTVLVKQGTYVGLVTITKDIRLMGVDHVILTADEGPIVRVVDSRAHVSGVTLTGEASDGVEVIGGSPTLTRLEFWRVGTPQVWAKKEAFHDRPSCERCLSLSIMEGSAAIVEGNTFAEGGGIWVEAGASPRIEDNELGGGSSIKLWGAGDATIVRGNTIRNPSDIGIEVNLPSRIVIEENTIIDPGLNGISVGWGSSDGVDPVIRGNTISGSKGNAIGVASGAQPTIEGNTLTDNRNAIFISSSDARVAANDIHGNTQGILIRGGSPTLQDNVVTGSNVGLALDGPTAGAILSGNRICANETDVLASGGAQMPDTGGDAACGETAGASPPGT